MDEGRDTTDCELETAALDALRRFGAPAEIIAIRAAEVRVARALAAIDAYGYFAVADTDPLLLDNEGPIGPPGAHTAVSEYLDALLDLEVASAGRTVLAESLGLGINNK